MTRNIGGLIDCDVALPDQQQLAIAGANGTGKSKLLACLLVPWTQALPPARDAGSDALVEITIILDEPEIQALQRLDAESGWNQGRLPTDTVVLSLRQRPLAGFEITARPDYLAVRTCFTNQAVLKAMPSLNLVYLPAERRLLPPNSNVVDLSQLAEDVGLAKLAEARSPECECKLRPS